MNALPNLLCVGTQKAGTSTLFDILRQHPDIYLPSEKEAHYFYSDKNYCKGVEWYKNTYYSEWKGQRIIGDFTPEYMYWPNVPERIRATLGVDVKFVFILRHPVDRAYSQYLMTKKRGVENMEFLDALGEEQKRIELGLFERNHFGYFSRSRYLDQIRRFMECFPRENMFFIVFETEIREHIEVTIAELLKFVGLDTNATINCFVHSNEASSVRFPWLARLMWQGSLMRNLARTIVPSAAVRSRIFKATELINSSPVKNDQRLDKNTRDQLYSKYFQTEFDDLQNLTGKSLDVWLR